MKLNEFHANLKDAFSDTYEIAAPKDKQRYVVWHRYGRSSVYGDNRNQVDGFKVQIDIVTNIYDDPMIYDIMAALWAMDLPYRIESEEYDDDKKLSRVILQLVVV